MFPICEKTGTQCRHCSEEKHINLSYVGNIKTGRMEKRISIANLGQFCNNDGKKFVRDMIVCPLPDALSVKLVKRELTELEWMKLKSS